MKRRDSCHEYDCWNMLPSFFFDKEDMLPSFQLTAGGRRLEDEDNFDAVFEAMNGSSKLLDLPGDTVMAILLALPVKTLLRFKCVCRSWNALILSLPFINMHHNKAKHSSFIWFRNDLTNNCTSVSEDGIFTNPQLPPPTLGLRSRHNVVAAACRGMICFSSLLCPNSAVVWNIATREFRIFHGIGRDINSSYFSMGTGFTFLPISNNYKLVRVIMYANHAYIKITKWNRHSISIPAKEMETAFPYRVNPWPHSVNANEAIHWLGRSVGGGPPIVIAFDMVEDKFREISTPLFYQDHPFRPFHQKLALLNETTLAIFDSSKSSTGLCYYIMLLHIWTLHDYRGASESWAKQFTIEAPDLLQPIGFWLNGEVVFSIQGPKLRLYDTHTNQIKDFPLDIPTNSYSSIIHYKESLVPLTHMNKMTNKCSSYCPFDARFSDDK